MEKRPSNIKEIFARRLKIYLRVAAITITTVGIFGGLGYFLDLKFGKNHTFLLIGLIISYPITMTITYKVFKKISLSKSNGGSN